MNIGYVYIITNILNNKQYVGQKLSSTFVKSYYGSGNYIKSAVNKYGKENFKQEILCWCESREDMNVKEQYYIEYYNTLYPNGYNMTLNTFNSGLKQKHSEATKEKIRQKHLNKTIEEKKQISIKFHNTISKRTEVEWKELKEKISNSVKNSENFKKVISSPEYKKHLSDSIRAAYNNKDLNMRNRISEGAKLNWKNEDYYNKCIKNLKHNDSKKQHERSLKGNITNQNSGFKLYNKSEKAREKSKEMAKNMQNIIKNMTPDEKNLMKLKIKFKGLYKKYGLENEEVKILLSKIRVLDQTYDIFDSPKDRLLNKKFPIKKLISKEILEFKDPIPVYDITVKGKYSNFQTDSQIFVHNSPGAGKSKTMAYLAKQALMESKKVIFITLELDEVETEANLRTAYTGISFFEMLNPENREEFIKKTEMFKNTFSQDCLIKFYKPSTVTADTIYNYIQKVMQYKKEKFNINWKPDVIFLDYLDKLLPTQKVKGSLYEDIGGVADDCKNLAITFNCPVITGSQLGRATWNIKGSEVISLDSLAESARKAHLAHTITTVNANPGEKAVCKARLFMAKSRSGKPGTTIYIEQNLGKCLLYEVDPWDPDTLQGTVNYSFKSSAGGNK